MIGPDLSHLGVRRAQKIGIVGEGHDPLVDLEGLAPLLQTDLQLGERQQRGEVIRIEVGGARERGDGLRRLPQVLALDPRDAGQQLDPRRRRRVNLASAPDAAQRDIDEVLPALLSYEQLLEARCRVLVQRVELQATLEQLDGTRHVVGALLVEDGGIEEGADPQPAVSTEIGLARLPVRRLCPPAHPPVEPPQLPADQPILTGLGGLRQRLGCGVERPGHLLRRRQTQQEHRALICVLFPFGQPLKGPGQSALIATLLVDAAQRTQRTLVRADLRDPLVELGCVLLRLQLHLGDLRRLLQERQGLLGLLTDRGRATVGVDEQGVLAGVTIEPRQRLERLAISRVDLEHLAIADDRAGRVTRLLRANVTEQLEQNPSGPIIQPLLQRALEHGGRLRRVPLRHQSPEQGVACRLVPGLQLEGIPVARQRGVTVVEMKLAQLANSVEQIRALTRIRTLCQAALEDVDQRGPVAASPVDATERFQRRWRRGVDLERRSVGAEGLLGLVETSLAQLAQLTP